MPFSTKFKSNLDALVNVFRTALVVDTQLQDVAILDGEGLGLGVGRAQSNVVQERPRARLGVSNVKFAPIFYPDLRMSPRDDLGLERQLVRVEGIDSCQPQARSVGEATYPERRIALAEVSGDGVEP